MDEEKKVSTVSRRGFIAGLTAAGAATALVAATGCASESSSAPQEATAEEVTGQGYVPQNIAETLEADIVVIGGGIAGLSATVQAAQNGSNVILLECQPGVGGDGQNVEGTFGLNTEMQKAAGIEHYTDADILSREAVASQYRTDLLLWKEFVEASADNFAWLVENGVEFSGEVSNYGNPSAPSTMHFYPGLHAGNGYTGQMEAAALAAGATIMTSTKALSLIKTGDAIEGVYAENDKGEDIQINAPAVIIATGGFGGNPELMQKLGYEARKIKSFSMPGHDGDGYRMAMEVGAKDNVWQSTLLANNFIDAWPHDALGPYNAHFGIGYGGPMLWVNEDAVRFSDEFIAESNLEIQTHPGKNQREMYTIFDKAIYDYWIEWRGLDSDESWQVLNDALAANEGDSFFEANSYEELAQAFDLDVDTFVEQMNRYNELCKAGVDDDFGKKAEMLQAIENPPYYIGRVIVQLITQVGNITTNRNFEVVDDERNVIPGLYAAGNDGSMYYRGVYSINIPGTCSATAVHGGRTAANNAKAYIENK